MSLDPCLIRPLRGRTTRDSEWLNDPFRARFRAQLASMAMKDGVTIVEKRVAGIYVLARYHGTSRAIDVDPGKPMRPTHVTQFDEVRPFKPDRVHDLRRVKFRKCRLIEKRHERLFNVETMQFVRHAFRREIDESERRSHCGKPPNVDILCGQIESIQEGRVF